jgi:hypothetical protein
MARGPRPAGEPKSYSFDDVMDDAPDMQRAPSILPIPEPATSGYPFDGRPVLVAADMSSQFVESVWRTSRSFDMKTGSWKHTGFWALRNGGGAKVPFEPTLYRAFVEPPLMMNKKAGAA